jgi:hypothetical protein
MVHARRKQRMLGNAAYFPLSHGRPRNILAFAQLKHHHNFAPTPRWLTFISDMEMNLWILVTPSQCKGSGISAYRYAKSG